MTISVAIIAKDAQKTLPVCLKSVSKLSNDIVVVVDTATSDQTKDVALSYGAKTFPHHFNDFSSQKNFAISKTKNAWVLSLDADEWVSDSLVAEIISLPDNPVSSAFILPRKNFIFGTLINHTNWDPNGLIRLFKKENCVWRGTVHEQLHTSGSVGKLTSPIYHTNYTTVEDFLNRQDKYSTYEASRLFDSGVRFNIVICLIQPIKEFFRRYVWHAGFLDGWHGLYLSYLMSLYHFSVWVKLWQKSRSPSL